jgi:phage regulator Rha-like protein
MYGKPLMIDFVVSSFTGENGDEIKKNDVKGYNKIEGIEENRKEDPDDKKREDLEERYEDDEDDEDDDW